MCFESLSVMLGKNLFFWEFDEAQTLENITRILVGTVSGGLWLLMRNV
jgi:hypothetical protein